MDVSNREPARASSRRTRVMAAVAVVVVVAIVAFVASGAWAEFRQGFSEGLRTAPGSSTTTR